MLIHDITTALIANADPEFQARQTADRGEPQHGSCRSVDHMPRIALGYAIENCSPAQKAEQMKF